MSSAFHDIPETAHVAANELAFAIRDEHPVSPGHTLVVARRVVPTWFEATRDEQLAILDLIDIVKADLHFPIAITAPKRLWQALTRAAAQVGRPEGAKGSGNSTKRIRLVLTQEARGLVPKRDR